MTPVSLQFLAGGGDMGERMRAMEWRATPLGDASAWPPELRTLVSIMLSSQQPMFVAWGPTRAMLYNDAYAGILGNKHPQALGRDLYEVWHEIREAIEPFAGSALRGEPREVPRLKLVMQRHGYVEETWFSFFYAPVRDGSGQVAGMYCACNDITAQVAAEDQLVEREARHRGVLANMDEAFVLFDRDFRVLEVNDEALRLVKRARGDVIGHTYWELFPGSYDGPFGRMYRRVVAEGQPGVEEHAAMARDGTPTWYELRAFPVEDGLAVFFRDVTERRRTDEQAALAAERVQLALDAGAIIGTWVWTVPDNRFIADERFALSFGQDAQRCREGLSLEAVAEAIHPEDWPRVQEAIAEAMRRGGPYRCEYRVRRGDGEYHWIEANGRVELDADGNAVRFPGVLIDNAERRRVEAERDRANALLRSFIEAVPGVVYAKDREGRLVMANRGTAELLGVPPEFFLGRMDSEVLADREQAEAVMANDRRIMASGEAEQIEEDVRLASGESATWLSTKAPLRDAEGNVVGLIGASIDITDRKRVEEALRLSEQRSALALELAQLGTWQWDLRRGVMTVDARFAQICGLGAPAEYPVEAVLARLHPDDRLRVEASIARAITRDGIGHCGEEFRWLHPDGRVVWTVTRARIRFEGEGDARAAVTMIGSAFDITERRRMIDSLEQADRRKDEFLAMLAHELRNPLAPIGTAAQLLKMAPGDEDQVRSAADIIGRQVGHMSKMVADLLDVSRVTRGLVRLEREPVDVHGVVAAAIEQAEPFLRARRHRWTVRSTGAAPAGAQAGGAIAGGHGALVLGDRHRLVQVVSNLLHNAAKYTPAGGFIELSVEADGDDVAIRVADNGIGMDERLVPGVFDLFTQAERTPDREQGGLGIGLALVRSIVQLHGGQVSAHSAGPGHGSVFTVVLPRVARIEAPVAADEVPCPAPHRRKVLVVDDNRDAADTLAAVLRMLGHDIAVAASGEEALAVAVQDSDWDAFILDIGMPGMTGHELAARLRGLRMRREPRLIALTGYALADAEEEGAGPFDHHMVKPADIGALHALLVGEPVPAATLG